MDEATLKNLVAEVALKELREDGYTREQALHQFRDWVEKHPDIRNCRTDDSFLLRFLRVRKFSVTMAEQTLLNFLKFRQTFPHICRNLDICDPSLDELLSCGYMVACPHRDEKGRQIIIYRVGNVDAEKVRYQDAGRFDMMTNLTLMEDEASQVLGYVYIYDCTNATLAHATKWPLLELAQVFQAQQKSFPMRQKAYHILNMPPVLQRVVEMVKSFSSKKIQERFYFHKSVADLHKDVDRKVLPEEYGGTMPAREMIDLWKQKLMAERDVILGLANIQLLQGKSDLIEIGSFRKLNLD